MQRARPPGGREEQGSRSLALARREPVVGDEPRFTPPGLEQLGERSVERAPPPPRRVRVDSLADEVVAESRDAGLGLDDEPVLEGLRDAGVVAESR
jgi:hypothetical protein